MQLGQTKGQSMPLGAIYKGKSRCKFVVWAPDAHQMEVHLLTTEERFHPMTRNSRGYWVALVDNVSPNTDYFFRLDGTKERPDPASHCQPFGVHKASRVIDHSIFPWKDQAWRGYTLDDLVIYELHVGTFSAEGTFAAVIPRLPEFVELGITAIELMPVAQFPGERNWGYDGVHPFAVQHSYGGPNGLKALVDACHRIGLALLLDVVYNHLGPEGNYLRDFGPYFNQRYHSPWGEPVNLDAAGSDEVRRFFIENAFHWFRNYHIDGLRIDAIHALLDFSAKPFLQELAEKTKLLSKKLRRPCLLIAESDLNDSRIIRTPRLGGYGLDAQWSDDFHHAVHTLLTREQYGYYRDFGHAEDLATALRNGFVYAWRYSPYRGRRHGNSASDLPGRQFVVCSQNHDQIGNRARGERLICLAGIEGAKLAAATVLLAPFVPLLFMGEEYGETSPFKYFVSFLDRQLNDAVQRGRTEEFKDFHAQQDMSPPDAPVTFEQSKLAWDKRRQSPGKEILSFYRRLLELRKNIPALGNLEEKAEAGTVSGEHEVVWMRRRRQNSQVLVLMNYSAAPTSFLAPASEGTWEKLLDSADSKWLGPGVLLPTKLSAGTDLNMPRRSCALYQKIKQT